MTLIRAQNSMPSLMERFLNNDLSDWGMTNFSGTNTTLPAVNVKENDNEFTIEVAAPGMKKDDFKVNLDNDCLTISSEPKTKEEEDENKDFTRREFCYQSFRRSFELPEHIVDEENINVEYNNGILYVKLPKREENKSPQGREIKIS